MFHSAVGLLSAESLAGSLGVCRLHLLERKVTEKDFIGFAVLSITFSPEGEISNLKGTFDEQRSWSL